MTDPGEAGELERAIGEVRRVLEGAHSLTEQDWQLLGKLSHEARALLVNVLDLSDEQRRLLHALLLAPTWQTDRSALARGAHGLHKLGAIRLDRDQGRAVDGQLARDREHEGHDDGEDR